MRYLILFLFSILFFTACQKAEQNQNASAEVKRYKLKGKVVSVDKAKKKAEIDHEEVKDYMKPMTMNFPIRADWVWDELSPGAEITADLVVDEAADEPYWLENIGIISAPRADQTAPPIDEKFAQIGKDAPDFSLTNQAGKKISLADFKGKPLAITFIYAQCPLPEYCIKMSKNFSDLANQINANENLKDKIRLLSISFDPERDTPAKLKQYGIGYLGKDSTATDFKVWQIAVGADAEVKKIADAFGLRYEQDANDKTQFNHSLRTIVISPEGKVTKIFPGNEWSNAELLNELQATLK
ncbi:SCO family protein [soil metagenome]